MGTDIRYNRLDSYCFILPCRLFGHRFIEALKHSVQMYPESERAMGTRYGSGGGGGGRGDRRNQRFAPYSGVAPRQSRPIQRLPVRREGSTDLETNLSSFYR